jgi:hypothetical protein
MIAKKSSYYRVLMLCIGLAITMGSLIWLQASASPASAQGPEVPVVRLWVQVTENSLEPLAVDPPPVFFVGDIFTISIVVLGVPDPGIFGSQFEVVYDTAHLQAVTGSLVPGDTLEPVVIALSQIDNASGVAAWAASRQGDLPDVPGDVVLASLTMEATGATEPPEGETTTIDLQNVKLGSRGGFEVDVAGLVPLDVIIRERIPDGDIAGNVKVEGRVDDNQAGHSVEFEGGLPSETTDALGDFLFADVEFGTYNLTANSPGFLAATCTGLVHDADPTVLNDLTLLAGDINDDDIVDVTDAVGIGSAFGGADPVADLNADGIVDVLDLILMSANFGQTAATNPWDCQP